MHPLNPYAKKSNASNIRKVGPCVEVKDSGMRLTAQNDQASRSNGCQNAHQVTVPPPSAGKTFSLSATPACKQPVNVCPNIEMKTSVTPSPTLKLPLKQQLKYEIAMLKKQKKDRIIAKQSTLQPVTQIQPPNVSVCKEGDQQPRINFNTNGSHQSFVALEKQTIAPVPRSCNSVTSHSTNSNLGKNTYIHNQQNINITKAVHPINVPTHMHMPLVETQTRPPMTPGYQHFYPIAHHAFYHGAPLLHHQQIPYPFTPMYFQSNQHLPNPIKNNALIPSVPKAPSMILHTDPLHQSFFGKTHCLLKTQIKVVKKEGESFGINLKYETKINSKTKETCGVLMVTNSNVQNLRAKPGTNQVNLLQKGDIIISINSTKIFGLQFREATSLFAKCNRVQEPNMSSETSHASDYVCTLTIARDKKRAKLLALLENLSLDTTKSLSIKGAFGPAPPKVPFIINDATGMIMTNNDFNSTELNALITGYLECQGQSNADVFSDILLKPIGMKDLRQRTVIDCSKKWEHMRKVIELEMSSKAISHWKSVWKDETKDEEQKQVEREFISDSERSFLRQRPRPSEGCKCGSKEHVFVNHPDCFLYRHLRKSLDPNDDRIDETGTKSSEKIAKYDSMLKNKTLNSIGNAHLQRMKNQLEEQEAERNEAVFVNQMEQIQAKRGIAVFSPKHKSVMVLSAIASCQEKLVDSSNNDEKSAENRAIIDPESDDDSDDDDDIPLNAALGKRSATPSDVNERKSKTARFVRKLSNLVSLGSILEHISITWGHLFMDPLPVEEAW